MTRSDFVLRGPDVLPVLAPYLCGFVPGRSLVVIGLDPDRIVRVTLRFDLPDESVPGQVLSGELADQAAALSALARAGADRAVVLVYPLDEQATWPADYADGLPHPGLAEVLEEALTGLGVHVLDRLCVVGERSRSYGCTDHDCCPPHGRLPDAAMADVVRAHFVEREVAVLPSRAALVASLQPRPAGDPLRAAVVRRRAGVLMRLPSGEAAQVEAFAEGVRAWARLPRDQVRLARLIAMVELLVSTIGRRDLLLHRLTAAPDRSLLGPARQVLAEAVRCAPMREPGPDGSATPDQGSDLESDLDDVAAVATTLAVCAWVDGDGAAAWVALDRAGAAAPDYRLAQLVRTALMHGFPPTTWSSMMAELSDQEILGGARHDPERWPA